METVLITCDTIKDEVQILMRQAGVDYPTIWLDAGLHRSPERLRATIMAELDQLSGPHRVLLPMGCCGGGVDNIPAGPHTLIVPRCDDCLTLLLGSMSRRLALQNEAGTYFLTAGWLRGLNDLVDNYDRSVERMGKAKADRAHKMALAHYKRYMFIETGTYDLEEYQAKVAPLAALLDLAIEEIPGDLGWLGRMVSGPWSEQEFVVTPPGETLHLITV